MRHSKAALAAIAVLMAAVSVPVLARGHSGGGGHGGHASSGWAGHGGHGGHASSGWAGHGGRAFSGAHAPAGGAQRAGRARIGVFIGAPLYAPLFYPAPRFYYPPYIEPIPSQAYWYFCPELNAYYPYVQQCPGGWQPVAPQPPGFDPHYPG